MIKNDLGLLAYFLVCATRGFATFSKIHGRFLARHLIILFLLKNSFGNVHLLEFCKFITKPNNQPFCPRIRLTRDCTLNKLDIWFRVDPSSILAMQT